MTEVVVPNGSLAYQTNEQLLQIRKGVRAMTEVSAV